MTTHIRYTDAPTEPVPSLHSYHTFMSKRELFHYVGMRYEFLSQLNQIELLCLTNEENVNHLKTIMKNNLLYMEQNNVPSQRLEDIIFALGFTRERSNELKKWMIEDAYSSHQSVLYFANVYIENKLSQKVFPLRSRTRPLFFPPQSNNDTIVLFHSTTRHHAQQIASDKIRTSFGQPCQDFSHNGGFYLSDNLEYAIKWSELRSYGSDPAILVYIFPRKLISMFKGLHLYKDSLTDMTLWKKIIQYNHNERKENSDKMSFIYEPDVNVNYQNNVDYIVGPVSLYGGASMFTNVVQMCVLTQHFADALCIDNNKYLYQLYEWGGSD